MSHDATTHSPATDAIMPDMRALTGGTFLMGDAAGRADEQPVREVMIAAFEIAVCPVTVGEYKVFLQATDHDLPREWGVPPFDEAVAPVCGVSWFDAVTYARWLSALTGRNFHLPTEAQREFAARGGMVQVAYPWGDSPPSLTGVYERGLTGDMIGGPMPVRCNAGCGANAFGLWHMADNVHEWCADYYDRKYYDDGPSIEPRGPGFTDRRAARGGSWRHDIKFSRCAARSSLAPDKRFTDFGFRLACSEGFEYVE